LPGARDETTPARRPGRGRAWRVLPWAVSALCFAFLFSRVDAAARSQGVSALNFLASVFERVDWWRWLALMIPYSILYFLIESCVIWRVINWFHARVSFRDILPVRASTYILSILNEQMGKGAMALYLHRREGVPGWQVASSMLFLMVCEFYYLLAWACLGVLLRGETAPPAFRAVFVIAAVAFPLLVLFTRVAAQPSVRESRFGQNPLFHTFARARLSQYALVIALRAPAMAVAAFVYAAALSLFGISSSPVEMLGVLPLIFFGAATPGPLRAVAISMWVLLFPNHPAEMTAFGLVMHNFFIFFNASIGLLFLRRANRELFG